jgi:hypothetical protein
VLTTWRRSAVRLVPRLRDGFPLLFGRAVHPLRDPLDRHPQRPGQPQQGGTEDPVAANNLSATARGRRKATEAGEGPADATPGPGRGFPCHLALPQRRDLRVYDDYGTDERGRLPRRRSDDL